MLHMLLQDLSFVALLNSVFGDMSILYLHRKIGLDINKNFAVVQAAIFKSDRYILIIQEHINHIIQAFKMTFALLKI